GSKVRAPFYSEDRRIIISADGVLTLRGADASDTGLYWCIATNYLDADVLTFRITVLSVNVEESEINGLWLSKSVGENLKLDCSSSGSPEGSVSWILPDHSVLEKSQANRKVYENGTLLIQHLTARDRGFYRCLVANPLGIDLLVSQLMLSEERIEAVTALNSEGSSKLMDTKMDSNLEDHQVNLNENTSSALVEIMSQEFRTVTSAHPHPRLRLQGRGNSQGRIGQRRRGAGHNRHIWSSRMFGKASRRVDPHKFAEFMKKAHNGPKIKTSTINEIAKNDIRHPGSSGDEEIGSGGGYEEEHLIVATLTVKPTTETMEPYKQSDSSQIKPMFTHLPSQFETTEFYPLERTSRPPPNLDHVTLQLSRPDNKQVTQQKFLGEQTAERETATEVAIQSTTDPNVTPILDDLDPVGLVLHTDTESQMTFTAITTTDKGKDIITFHTTQTIKSPQLSAGSTIISQQQIQIIPRKSNRGKGGRRTPYGRRRLIKPNRINDIQHFINRFKQPTVKKEENTTGKTITISEKMGKFVVLNNGTLTIKNANIKDQGQYLCLAENGHGSDKLLVTLSVVAYPSRILEPKMREMKSHTGDRVEMKCKAEGRPLPMISWILANRTQVRGQNTEKGRVLVSSDGTLVINHVSIYDRGYYKCIASNPAGADTAAVRLQVVAAPPGIVEQKRQQLKARLRQNLWLSCTSYGTPHPSIHWVLHDGTVVRSNKHTSEKRISVFENGTLFIKDVNPEDKGKYECIATSSTGSERRVVTLSVEKQEYPPEIVKTSQNMTELSFGDQLRLNCLATGDPKPRILWRLPSEAVADHWHSPSEEGDYTCYAENQVGKDEMHVHITVVATAPRIRPPSQTYARVKPGENIRFDCETFGEPKPKILWRLPNNDVIAASNERYLIHVNGSLDIRDVKLIDAGEYVCMARNPGGENRKVYKLDIDGNPPVINGYHQNRTVIKDVALKHSRKLLDCIAEGDPTPTVTWIMPDNIFLSAPYFGSRVNVHLNGTLEIRNVRPSDTAEFICLARNDRGEAVMVVQLEVTNMLRRPIFKNPFNERLVSRIGKTAILNCSADGQPMPEIIWTLPNGTRITTGSRHSSRHRPGDDGTLVIYSSREEDSGKYRCGARNLLGYIEKLIILNIGEKPYIFTRPKGIIRSISGEPLYLHCLSDGSPRPRIYWTIPGGHTFTHPQILGRYHLLENGTLVVHDSSIHDKGNYICKAHNNAGEAQITVPVFVIAYPPRITTGPPPRLRALSGTPLKLNCAATGIPKPEITWELPDNSILSAAKQGRPMGSELFHPLGTLVIQKPSSSDSGQYKCSAKNYLGADSKVTIVLIL
ncbi:hypothetical protein XENOCAPTIV_015910, partial [Xenoophorus captivus]